MAFWRIVGSGFNRLIAVVVLLVGIPATLIDPSPASIAGASLAALGLVAARRQEPTVLLLAGSSVAYLVAGFPGGAIAALTGGLLLGGVSGEMLLGHWYLVDPRLPRWALHRLDAAALAGAVLEAGQLVGRGALSWQASDTVLGWAFVALTLMTFVLLTGVWFALKEPRYSGVMAATGLSYLAIVTATGMSLLGRTIIEESA